MPSAPIAGHNTQLYIASTPTSLTNEAMTDSGDHMTFNDSTVAHQCWNNRAAFVVQVKRDEMWTVTISGGPTGGVFTLTFGGQTTANIAYNASAATVQAAFVALSSVGSGNATVTGSAGGPWTIEFVSSLGYAAQGNITANSAGLTGGSSPAATPARVQAGQGFTTVSSGFTINYPIGQVVFASALLGTAVVQISSGSYLPTSFLAWCKVAQPSLKAGTLETTSFTNPPSFWKTFIGGLLEGTIKLSLLWIDGTFLNHMSNNDLLIIQIYPGQNANQRLQGYGILNTDMITGDVSKVNEEEIDFIVNGQLYFIPS